MSPLVATVICALGIAGLLYLDRGWNYRPSKALYIPAVWLFFTGSRCVSDWLGRTLPMDTTEAYVEGSPIDRTVFMVLLAAAFAVVVRRAERAGPLLKRNAPILLFFFYCAASIVWSDFPLVAFKRWTKAVGDVAMILVILTEPEPVWALKWLITRLGYLLFPLSVLFIRYYPYLGRRLTPGWTLESVGVTSQKNQLGMICLMYGLGFLWSLRATHRDRQDPNRTGRMLAFGTILVMITWLLWSCDSKSGICSLGMAGGMMLLVGRLSFARKPAFVHLLVLAMLSISSYALFFDATGGIVASLGRDPSLTGRKTVWNLILSMHTNRWVGAGFESFWLGNRLTQLRDSARFGLNEAHNGYLEVYLNLGWTGVSLLGLLLVTGYRKAIAKLRQDPDTGSLLLACLLATVFCSLSESAFRMMTTSWIFLLLATFAATLATSRDGARQVDSGQADGSAELKPRVEGVQGAAVRKSDTEAATTWGPQRWVAH